MVLHERVPSCIDLNFDPGPWNCSAFSEVHVAVRRVDSSCSFRLLGSDTMQVACVLYYLFFAGRRCLEKKVQKLRHVCACPCMSTGKTNELVLDPCHANGQTYYMLGNKGFSINEANCMRMSWSMCTPAVIPRSRITK